MKRYEKLHLNNHFTKKPICPEKDTKPLLFKNLIQAPFSHDLQSETDQSRKQAEMGTGE